MSSHYEPISVESDHEDNNEAGRVPMLEDDARTERTRSTDRSQFIHEHDDNSDEDPQEEATSADHRVPLLASDSGRRPFGQIPRIRVTMPRAPERIESSSPTPPPNPNARTPPGFHIWERTLRTLKRWRDNYQYTPAPQMESSSSTRQEFLLDTTPIVVDKLVRHEEKLDQIEDIIMDLPGPGSISELQYQIDNADGNISYVNDEVQTLKKRVEEMAQQFKSMDFSIHQMENKMWDCQTMTAMAMGTTQDNLRQFFGKHQGNSSSQ